MARFGEAKYGTSHYGMTILLSEAVTFADALVAKLSKSIIEGSSGTAFGQAQFGGAKYGQRWSVTLLDALAVKTGKAVTDAVSLAETVSLVLQHHVSVGDTAQILDALVMKFGLPVSDGMALIDAVNIETQKSLEETIALAEAIGLKISKVSADVIAFMEAVGLKTAKALSEAAMSLSETVQALYTLLPSVQVRYQPRPLITLTLGADTKQYSTENIVI